MSSHRKLGPVSRFERKVERKVTKLGNNPISRGYNRLDKKLDDTGDKLKTGLAIAGAAGLAAYVLASGDTSVASHPDFKDSYFHIIQKEENYMKSINENLKTAIDMIAAGENQEDARNLIYSELAGHISARLDDKKVALAKALYSGSGEEANGGQEEQE